MPLILFVGQEAVLQAPKRVVDGAGNKVHVEGIFEPFGRVVC